MGEAYAVLSDPKKKARYDSGQDLEEMEGMGSGWRKFVLQCNCMSIIVLCILKRDRTLMDRTSYKKSFLDQRYW